jgi:hypothetical protein
MHTLIMIVGKQLFMEMMTEMMFPMMRILVDLIYLKWKLFIMSFLMLKIGKKRRRLGSLELFRLPNNDDDSLKV